MVLLSEHIEGSSSSTGDHRYKYDVFLSFRGVDTRLGFTAHLYQALLGANISTFLDDEEIETGDGLKPEFESAIKESRASIIVLSKNFAYSSWCLDELVLILEENKSSNQIVFPIFYHVEPTHVRKQQNSFGDAMAKHKQTMKAETNENNRSQRAQKIDRWTHALIEVALLKGMNANGRQEPDFIDEIVKDIHRRLHISSRIPLPQLIGINDSKEFVISWVKDTSSNTANILTILGMGGIGKSSLAKYVYGLHSREFDRSSFIDNISRRCEEKFNGLLDLQKQLHDDISKRSSLQVHDVSIYTSMIENDIACKKVLLVLDDVDSPDQLDALLGSKGIHPKSKIIITTKDVWLTKSCALFKSSIKPTHAQHLLRDLHQAESKQLLCSNAFLSNNPKAGYEDVLQKLLNYCGGHPLALKVMGKSLYNRDLYYWEDFMEGLKKETDSRVNNVLRKSFDSLSMENDKELFKHVACFFVGIDRDFSETVLKACDIKTRSGIMNLTDKCLLCVERDNKLMMHGLLQEMGRSIVRQESPNKPWERSRLWCHEDSLKVLKQTKGKGNLLGLTFDIRMIEKGKLQGSFALDTDALCKMNNLMLLQLNYVQVNGPFKKFPKELRWLCMHGFPSKCIPSDLPVYNLVALDMSYSNFESFLIWSNDPQKVEGMDKLTRSSPKDKKLFGSLKILNLSFCKCLHSLVGFVELPALERLIARNCNKLRKVCESVNECVELVYIDLSYCNKLENLDIGMLRKVETLSLEGCNLASSRMVIRDVESLEMVKTNNIGIHNKLSSSAFLKAIPSDSKFMTVSLPSSLVKLSLKNNKLSTESFPTDFSCLSMLLALYLDYNPISSLPNCVRSLPRLMLLSMSYCELTSIEHPPKTLTNLDIFSDKNSLLQKVVFDPEMCPLDLKLPFGKLEPQSCEIEGIVKIQPMEGVEEKVLQSLGWNKLDFVNKRGVRTTHLNRKSSEEYPIQMYYEFGIFSTIYAGYHMPNWIMCTSSWPSIRFNIPPSPNNTLKGLNFCYVSSHFSLSMIIIHNITKNRIWMYEHCSNYIHLGEGCYCYTMLSHWMFGMNDMEGGDLIDISISNRLDSKDAIRCGVGLVYDDGKTDKEDVLSYYKSWNHIIGGDLIGYQLTTGEYILSIKRHTLHGSEANELYPKLFGDKTHYKEIGMMFTALTRRMPTILGHVREEIGTSTYKDLILNDKDKGDEDEVEVILNDEEEVDEYKVRVILNALIHNDEERRDEDEVEVILYDKEEANEDDVRVILNDEEKVDEDEVGVMLNDEEDVDEDEVKVILNDVDEVDEDEINIEKRAKTSRIWRKWFNCTHA